MRKAQATQGPPAKPRAQIPTRNKLTSHCSKLHKRSPTITSNPTTTAKTQGHPNNSENVHDVFGHLPQHKKPGSQHTIKVCNEGPATSPDSGNTQPSRQADHTPKITTHLAKSANSRQRAKDEPKKGPTRRISNKDEERKATQHWTKKTEKTPYEVPQTTRNRNMECGQGMGKQVL